MKNAVEYTRVFVIHAFNESTDKTNDLMNQLTKQM